MNWKVDALGVGLGEYWVISSEKCSVRFQVEHNKAEANLLCATLNVLDRDNTYFKILV